MDATAARRLTFSPAPGHPGGVYARKISLPAGTPVEARETGTGAWTLTASVEDTDDYQHTGTAEDFTPDTVTTAAAIGTAALARLADDETNRRARALVTSGEAQWQFDPEHADVVVLVFTGTNRAAVVVYTAEDDFEDDGLYPEQ